MTADEQWEMDDSYMDRALDLANGGWGQVSPNPLVGAVLVSRGRVVGEGYHARFGGPHAEAEALREGRDNARGSTLYVTLEPCAHHGKTPPCTEAIRSAGVARVVYGSRDPDSLAGGGAKVLRAAGVEVRGGVEGLRAARLNAPFIWQRLGRGPWVSLKLGLSLDGRIAAREGVRSAITGREAAAYVHRLRAGHDAILVGGRTAVVDDPLLTVRDAPSPRVPPTRVVLDPHLLLPPTSRLVESTDQAPLVVLCRQDAPGDRRRSLEKKGASVESVAHAAGGLDLDAVMRSLEARELRSVMAEGGGRLAASLLAAGWVRRKYMIYAPVVFGTEGVPAFGAAGARSDGWDVVARRTLGPDSLLELEDRRAHEALMEAA